MRKLIFIAAVFALAITPALADFGDIIRSWDVPRIGNSGTCLGLAWDGGYIWCNVAHQYANDRMYRCLPSNGSVVSSFETGFSNLVIGRGMCYRPWGGQPGLEAKVSFYNTKEWYLYRFNFKGSVVNTLRVHTPILFTSVFFDKTNDWVCAAKEVGSQIYKLDDQGYPVSSFTLKEPGGTCGIAKQGDFFWFSIFLGYDGAYKTRANGSVVASFKTLGTPFDCTYENKHLWISLGSKVFCYDISNAPAVAPASVGRIKALFR
jgi:hypothetical protein